MNLWAESQTQGTMIPSLKISVLPNACMHVCNHAGHHECRHAFRTSYLSNIENGGCLRWLIERSTHGGLAFVRLQLHTWEDSSQTHLDRQECLIDCIVAILAGALQHLPTGQLPLHISVKGRQQDHACTIHPSDPACRHWNEYIGKHKDAWGYETSCIDECRLYALSCFDCQIANKIWESISCIPCGMQPNSFVCPLMSR